MNRSTQSQRATAAPQPGDTIASADAYNSSSSNDRPQPDEGGQQPAWVRWLRISILALGVVILVAIIGLLATSRPESQSKFVDKGKLQAVFLNNGQVYFGNIKSVNSQYFVLSNIYYLQTQDGANAGSNAAASNISLIKLGCELHQPYDQMVINRDQVTFWENLKDGGQVANKIKEFKTQNPNGQQCNAQAAPANNNVQGNNAGTGTNNNANTPAPTSNTTPNTETNNSANTNPATKTPTAPRTPTTKP